MRCSGSTGGNVHNCISAGAKTEMSRNEIHLIVRTGFETNPKSSYIPKQASKAKRRCMLGLVSKVVAGCGGVGKAQLLLKQRNLPGGVKIK